MKDFLIVLSCYGVGGAQRRAMNLANEFVNNGYNVKILALYGADGSIEKNNNYFGLDKRIELVLIPDYVEQNKKDSVVADVIKNCKTREKRMKKIQNIMNFFHLKSSDLNDAIRGLRRCVSLRSYLISNQNATIISFGFNIFEIVYWATKGLNFKIIYAETNASDKFVNDRNFKATCKLLKKADSLVFQTNEQKDFLGYSNSNNAVVIHNPIKSGLPELFAGDRKPVVVNFCRLAPPKNLMLLVKAFEIFSKNNPKYTLEIYADSANPSDSSLKEELLAYIENNNLSDKVFILPPTSDILNVIKDCSMFVSSSDYEGISNSMIEAMAMGLPCVCTDCNGGGAREMIKDGENGLLVPIRDAEALSQAMHRMANEKGLAEKCGKNAANIRDNLSVDKIASQWLNVIDSLNRKR